MCKPQKPEPPSPTATPAAPDAPERPRTDRPGRLRRGPSREVVPPAGLPGRGGLLPSLPPFPPVSTRPRPTVPEDGFGSAALLSAQLAACVRRTRRRRRAMLLRTDGVRPRPAAGISRRPRGPGHPSLPPPRTELYKAGSGQCESRTRGGGGAKRGKGRGQGRGGARGGPGT